jgi:hypothetical protein
MRVEMRVEKRNEMRV